MKLLFKQRAFTWFDSYDIYNEAEETVYIVKGQPAWGHCLKIFDPYGNEIGTLKQRIFTFLPKFEMYVGEDYVGCISREFSFLHPHYSIDCNGWQIDGNFLEWDYTICNENGQNIASVSKELFHWTDTYVMDVYDPLDALCALMVVLAIDADKCSNGN